MIPSGAREEDLLQSIDAGLDVFGKSVKSVIYWRFSKIYQSGREDIPRKPELFTESLRSFFGERAFSVEASIVGSIINNFRLPDLRQSDSLIRAIVEARKQIRSMT